MPCFHPLTRFVAEDGTAYFKRVSNEIYDQVYAGRDRVPCRGCIGCRIEKSRQWSVRIMHELQTHDGVGAFVTLTYDDAHLPMDGSISVRHWQLFAKSFRRRFGPFRFYMCGEYGDQTERPHYHVCIFGHDFREDRRPHSGGKFPLWTSPSLEETWGKGFAPFGEITLESAAYTARYILKKITGERAEDHYQGRTPEFNIMSRGGRGGKGGLGKEWFEKFSGDCYPKDFLTFRGKKLRPPVYYDRLLEAKDQELLADLKAARIARQEQFAHDATARRLADRKACAQARARQLTRRYE